MMATAYSPDSPRNVAGICADTGCSHTIWPRSAPAPPDPTTARQRPRSGSRYRQNATPRADSADRHLQVEVAELRRRCVAATSPAGVPILTHPDARRRVGLRIGITISGARSEAPGLLFSGRAQATLHPEHLVARGAYRGSVMGEPPIGRDVVFLRVNRIADDNIVERWRPERSSRSRARSQTCGSRTRRR